jgi:hypothetical protein
MSFFAGSTNIFLLCFAGFLASVNHPGSAVLRMVPANIAAVSCLLYLSSNIQSYVSSRFPIFFSLPPINTKVYFHRLADFPGPASRAAFYFPEFFHIFRGDSHIATRQLHEKYGEVVRIVPDGLTFTTDKAWQGTFGVRLWVKLLLKGRECLLILQKYAHQHGIDMFGIKANKRQLEKDRDFLIDALTYVQSIIHSTDEDHDCIRKQVSYAFSGTALREHEPLMKHYLELLLVKLSKQVDGPAKGRVDMTQWFNLTAFDIITRLTLDDCFNLLEQEKFNFWTEEVFKGIKLLRYLRVMRRYPILWWTFEAISWAVPTVKGKRNAHMDLAIRKCEQRPQRGSDSKDFMSYVRSLLRDLLIDDRG